MNKFILELFCFSPLGRPTSSPTIAWRQAAVTAPRAKTPPPPWHRTHLPATTTIDANPLPLPPSPPPVGRPKIPFRGAHPT